MSLMSKLLSLAALATLSLNATMDVDDVKDYIKHHMVKNEQVKVESVDIIGTKVLDDPKGWEVYFVNIHASVKKSPTIIDKVTVPETLFVKDGFAVPTLISMESGEDLKRNLKPNLKKEVYDKNHLIAGNKDAKHKIVVFSDPQCPFCQTIVPELYTAAVDNPDTFALYYYHLPLLRIHPASDTTSRAMLIFQKNHDVNKLKKMYHLLVNPRERDAGIILKEINKQVGTKIKRVHIYTDEIEKDLKEDHTLKKHLMVTGTPTIFIDDVWDPTRFAYKNYLPKK